MGVYEIECDVCGSYGESDRPQFKTVCIHCFNRKVKEVKRLKKENKILRQKLKGDGEE